MQKFKNKSLAGGVQRVHRVLYNKCRRQTMDRKNIGEMIKNGNKQMQFFTLFPHVFFFFHHSSNLYLPLCPFVFSVWFRSEINFVQCINGVWG